MNLPFFQMLYTFLSASCIFPRQFRFATTERVTVAPNDDASTYDRCCLYMEECVSVNPLIFLLVSAQGHHLNGSTLSALVVQLHMVE